MKRKCENHQKSEFWSSTKKIHNSVIYSYISINSNFFFFVIVSVSHKKIKTGLIFAISIPPRTMCEFSTSIFVKKIQLFQLFKIASI